MDSFQEGDTVALTADLPGDGLKRGMIGTIVTRFDQPLVAYETEFCDDDGRTTRQLALLPNQISKVVFGRKAS